MITNPYDDGVALGIQQCLKQKTKYTYGYGKALSSFDKTLRHILPKAFNVLTWTPCTASKSPRSKSTASGIGKRDTFGFNESSAA